MSIDLAAHNHFVLLDDMIDAKGTLLTDLYSHQYFTVNELAQLDAALENGWADDLYSFVYIPYEFGVDLIYEQMSDENAQKINHQIHIFWFQKKQTLSETEIFSLFQGDSLKPAGIAEPKFAIDFEEYEKRISDIHKAITDGDVYQINFTSKLDFKSYGHPVTLYRRLRKQQPVPYAALANLPLEQLNWLFCFSPELFLDIQADGVIKAKPMKGTAPILNDGRDEQRARDLQQDPKNRAENLMIVDLLRNDLGRIAKTGQVKVPALFEVNRFGEVWQMTSTVEAKMSSKLSFYELLKATFPCGSITGAPKKMSMELIESLEQRSRGIYTGSIGLIEPNLNSKNDDDLSFYGKLNVMIRSFHLQSTGEHFEGSMGVGSGIVIDSEASTEYDECFWKARFLLGLQPVFSVFETMHWQEGDCALLMRHKSRLLKAAKDLSYAVSAIELEQALAYLLEQLPTTGQYRLKLLLEPTANSNIPDNSHVYKINSRCRLVATLFKLDQITEQQYVLVKKASTFNASYLSRYKTDQRDDYDIALKEALNLGAFDQLLFDQNDRLLEGARSNVFLKIKGQWYCPSIDLPILNGVMRQEILENPAFYLKTTGIIEAHLCREDVFKAEEIVLSNALRGLLSVKLLIV